MSATISKNSQPGQSKPALWRRSDDGPDGVDHTQLRASRQGEIYKPEIFETIEETITSLSSELRTLSLDIHDHPEIKFEEMYAHDVLTAFMEKQGFKVTRHYCLPTAWLATFSHGQGGRTIGLNSEMDALPGIGHACGHNLIAIAGVAVACALKAALTKWNISGTVELLGTPAEEGGGGKDILLAHGAYKNMDVCLMCHPAPGPKDSVSLTSSLALQRVEVEYTGHTAHAALSPWEGQNALDAAVVAYTSVAVLRQQVKPTHRIHGIIEGRDWAPGIIPDYAKMIWYVRAPTHAESKVAFERVQNCFNAAALATACEVKIMNLSSAYDLRQNKALDEELSSIIYYCGGATDYEYGIINASTDFGSVTYALPSLHPSFAIPTTPNGGNHTPDFTISAATMEAHHACLNLSKALAGTAVRVLLDDEYFARVKSVFEEDKKMRGDV